MRKLYLVIVWLTFPIKALISNFWLLMNYEHFLRNHDQNFIKWWISLQNVDVDQKSWSLTVYRSQLTFDLIQLISSHLSNWLSKLVMQGMKIGMSILKEILGTMEITWGLQNPNFFVKNETLVGDLLLRRRICLVNS